MKRTLSAVAAVAVAAAAAVAVTAMVVVAVAVTVAVIWVGATTGTAVTTSRGPSDSWRWSPLGACTSWPCPPPPSHCSAMPLLRATAPVFQADRRSRVQRKLRRALLRKEERMQARKRRERQRNQSQNQNQNQSRRQQQQQQQQQQKAAESGRKRQKAATAFGQRLDDGSRVTAVAAAVVAAITD